MGRQEITTFLSKCIGKHIDPHNDPRIYWAKEVTFDYATGNAIRVDYMRYKPINNSVSGIEKGDFYCYEIKSSVADFTSKNGHNFIGDYNYYVMPEDVFDQVRDLIPYHVGVLTPGEFGALKSQSNARRVDRSRPASEMLLMMYRSSRREVVKKKKKVFKTLLDVIHCKECANEVSDVKVRELTGALWCRYKLQPCEPDDYCSHGERREIINEP